MIDGWCGSECHGVGHQHLSMSAHAPVPRVLKNSLMCASKPMCSCQLGHFHGVDVSCHVWTLCKAFRKWNCFGDDVVAEQPSHPCLVIHNAVSHVTPCTFLSSESWLEQCAFQERSLHFITCFDIIRMVRVMYRCFLHNTT